ncbi:MAG: nuclear transport factor 2 family protein [Acidimicrobiia bacterium]
MYDAEAIEAIKNLKARYYRCMDTKQWDGWNDVFAVDATLDTREEAPDLDLVVGRDNIIAFVSNVLTGVTTCHHGHMPEIELTSDTTATGIWAMEDHLWVEEGSELPYKSLHGYGHYHETYEKVDGKWYIKTLKLTRIRVDAELP